jgi:integrase/recombinase XerD
MESEEKIMEKAEKIQMAKKSTLTIEEAFDLFIRKCKVKNLTDLSISSYEKKMVHFYEFKDKTDLITSVTSNTIDDYILYLRENTQANDITINSYLRSVRAFLYYCMECGYIPNFKIKLIKAEKKIKETYTDEELVRLLQKPDTNNCSFSCYKTWVFENYLLGTGNRISTALEVQIGDINFQSAMITLRKTKKRRQQIIPLSNTLSDISQEYLQIRGGKPEDYLFCNEYGEKASERTYQQLVRRYNVKRNVNMFGQDLQMDFEKFNPLDNLKTKSSTIKMR